MSRDKGHGENQQKRVYVNEGKGIKKPTREHTRRESKSQAASKGKGNAQQSKGSDTRG